jgi:hypothetical protein
MNEDTDIYAPPTGEYLRSVVNDRLEIREAFGEFIDNSIDANARSIRIEIGEKKGGLIGWLRIEDDGDGCGDLIDMVRLGKHTEHKTTVLGRFGIGAKNAMLWLGGLESTVTIASTCLADGMTRRLRLAWKDYAKAWRISRDLLDESKAELGARGTVIEIRPCIRRFPEGKALDSLLRELGYLYSPAIKRGVQIQIRVRRRGADPVVLQRWELPALTDLVDTEIVVGERRAKVYVGIIKEGQPNPRPGITYVHGFRVVKHNGALGCGGMDHSNICGFVALDHSWELTKNKDDVSQHKEELGAAVFTVLRELLTKAAARDQALQFSEFNDEVEKQLNAMLGGPADSRGKRDPGEEKGTKTPKNTGRKHSRAAKEQDGTTFRRRFGSLRVNYVDLGDPEKLGDHSESRVILNTANAFIANVRAQQNKEAVALSALLVFMESVRTEEASGQRRLKYNATGDILRDIGKVLASPAQVDGRPLLSAVPTAAE